MAKTRFIYTTDETIVPGATELRPQQIPEPPPPPERFSDDENVTKIVYAKSGTKTLVFALVKSDEVSFGNGPVVNPLYTLYFYDRLNATLTKRNENLLSLAFYPVSNLNFPGWYRLSFGEDGQSATVVSLHKIKKATGPEELNIYNENIIVVLNVNNQTVCLNLSLDTEFIDLEMDVGSEWSVVSQTFYEIDPARAQATGKTRLWKCWDKVMVVRYLNTTNYVGSGGSGSYAHLGPGWFVTYNSIRNLYPGYTGNIDFYKTPDYIPTSSRGENAYGPELKLYKLVAPQTYEPYVPPRSVRLITSGYWRVGTFVDPPRTISQSSFTERPVPTASIRTEYCPDSVFSGTPAQCPPSFYQEEEPSINDADRIFETGDTYDKSLELRRKYGNENIPEFDAFRRFMGRTFRMNSLQINSIFNSEFPDYKNPNSDDYRRIPANRIEKEQANRNSARIHEGDLVANTASIGSRQAVLGWGYAPVPARFFLPNLFPIGSSRGRVPEGGYPEFDLVDSIKLTVPTRSQYCVIDLKVISVESDPLIKKIICFDDYKKVYAICSQVSEPNNSLYRIT